MLQVEHVGLQVLFRLLAVRVSSIQHTLLFNAGFVGIL